MASTNRVCQRATTLLHRSRLLSPCFQQPTIARAPSAMRYFSTRHALLADIIIKVPQMAESINEGTLSTFLKQVGERIEADDEVASIETDKIDVAVTAPEGGILRELLVEEGDVVTVGQPVARLETGDAAERASSEPAQTPKSFKEDGPATSAPGMAANPTAPSQAQAPAPSTSHESHPSAEAQTSEDATKQATQSDNTANYHAAVSHGGPSRFEREEKMSRMRKTIATRLKQSQNTCASLTTMQEVDMTALIAWRAKYKEEVAEKYGVRLGYMGAFTKAATLAAQEVPQMNASIDTDREMVTYRDYIDVSIAVSSPKGLITPVVRNTESATIVELEREIAALAQKAREGKLTMEDLQGGNFSISNPGIFGSMFGTPLINYPQAAVFNMNSIMQRPVVVDGKLEIRPMMYITVTYDHRLIDGREAVTFLNIVKKYIQDPSRLLL